MKKSLMSVVLVAMLTALGCNSEVPPGKMGRVNTPNGWDSEVLNPGRHSCYGRDTMYLVDVTNETFKEHLNILVGGKVNLSLDLSVRVRVNTDDKEMVKKAFEAVKTDEGTTISTKRIYETFLQMKALAIPRQIFEVQPDIQTAVANSPQLATEARKQMIEAAKATPLLVEDAQITNYDWPLSITAAQEELVKIQLNEAAEVARMLAELKRAEGQLKVEEANKLVELKKAEAVAESIDIIKQKLAGAPEYLMWHQIRVMGEAAASPNNCFILYPYTTDAQQVRSMLGNANLVQMLDSKGSCVEPQKKVTVPAAPGVLALPAVGAQVEGH